MDGDGSGLPAKLDKILEDANENVKEIKNTEDKNNKQDK